MPSRTLTVAALDPQHYQAGQAQRIHALLSVPGAALGENSAGYYMEVQAARLQQAVAGTDARVTSRGDSILIRPEGSSFASGSAHLAAGIRTLLANVAPVLEEYARTLITIHCYTDSTGAADYNQKLSERRALAVARYLLHAGVGGERILVVGHGEADPVASNATAKGRARNRRIVIELEPITR